MNNKKYLLIFLGLCVSATAFQNCSARKFSQESGSMMEAYKASVESEETRQVASESQSQPAQEQVKQEQTSHEVTVQPVQSCIASGQRVDGPAKYIYYRKCDNEIARWEEMFASKCCSGSVTIVDAGVNQDWLCSDGRFHGNAYCN